MEILVYGFSVESFSNDTIRITQEGLEEGLVITNFELPLLIQALKKQTESESDAEPINMMPCDCNRRES